MYDIKLHHMAVLAMKGLIYAYDIGFQASYRVNFFNSLGMDTHTNGHICTHT